jgi:hypothetical protein
MIRGDLTASNNEIDANTHFPGFQHLVLHNILPIVEIPPTIAP